MTSFHRSLLLQNSHAIPWSAPNTKPATVNSANPVRKARGLPEIGNGLAGASAASSPKGGNRTSKMAHKIYATLRVTVSESACTFQESAFGSAAVGVEDFASGAAFAWTQMLDNALDRAILPGSIPAFQDDQFAW